MKKLPEMPEALLAGDSARRKLVSRALAGAVLIAALLGLLSYFDQTAKPRGEAVVATISIPPVGPAADAGAQQAPPTDARPPDQPPTLEQAAVALAPEVEPEESRGPEIAQIITANLERSGLFRAVNPNAFIQDPESLAAAPRFADWRVIDADAVVAGSVAAQADGRLRAEFRLWDTVAETQLAGLAYFTAPDNFRRVAHIISDAIFTAVTGEPGYFDSRIVYISESGPATERVKRLAIMDQDGANHRHLTDGSNLVLTPRFSPSTQEITYLDYNGTQPRVFLYNIDTGRREVLGNFPGMTFSPRFSPDGNRVVMSLSQGGGTDLFVMDLRTRTSRRLTSSAGIDTSPCYNEDGTRIVVESDRGGSQLDA